jgi:hypothetical protein
MKYSDLDIVGINSITFISKEKQPSLPMQLCIYFAQLFYYTFIRRFKYKVLPDNYKGIVFLGVSLNNQRSLDPIVKHLEEGEYLYLKNHTTDIHKRRAYWLSLPYLPDLIKTYKKADAPTKTVIKRYFTRMWSTYGYYQLAKEYLEHYKVKVLALSSDQGEFHRCLLLNAQALDMKTIYVQHASVAKGFPKLIASYSFLDGQESLDKYLDAGKPEGEVYLSGGVRFDPIFQQYPTKHVEEVKTIGIAINMLDDFEKVKGLCGFLLGQGYKLALRPHPRYGSLDTAWLAENAIAYSDPKAESSFDFINKTDLMISNESSIHLDAAMMQCPSVLYNFSTHPILDHYAYIKSGLVKVADSEARLIDLIRDPKALLPAIETLQFYNASCGTQLEGHLGEAIATFIRAIVASNPIQHENQGFPYSISAVAFDCD